MAYIHIYMRASFVSPTRYASWNSYHTNMQLRPERVYMCAHQAHDIAAGGRPGVCVGELIDRPASSWP